MERIWQKIYGTGIPAEIDRHRYTSVVQLFQEAVVRYADLPAFAGLGGALSYGDVDTL